MPRPSAPSEAVRRLLALEGPLGATEITRRLSVSQPTLSRVVSASEAEILRVGRARLTRYALRRTVSGVGAQIPLFSIAEDGASDLLATLHATAPRGFYVEPHTASVKGGFSDDLPWFLDGLRPAGFLGRMVPAQHPKLNLRPDIRRWSSDETLAYLARYGADASGNLIVGDEALARHLAHVDTLIEHEARHARYSALADLVMRAGVPGSSAAGEQPKFLVARSPGPFHALVKFSPRTSDPAGQRWSDLLCAEHLAIETLRAHGHAAPSSSLVFADGRTFLEVTRFDRVGARGRRGLVALSALDAEFAGAGDWPAAVSALAETGVVPKETVKRVRWLHLFGRLIGNTDMHLGNLSFTLEGTRVIDLAPIYDMLPMRYAPISGTGVDREPSLVAPTAPELELWDSATSAALALWTAVTEHEAISAEFRAIARRERASILEASARLGR